MFSIIFLVFILASSQARRTIYQDIDEGLVNWDDPVVTQELIDDIKSKTNLWTPGFNKKWDGKTLRDAVQGLIPIPQLEARRRLLGNTTISEMSPRSSRRALPSSHYFYYNGGGGAYPNCYSTTNMPVRNQASCGSCYIFGAVQAFDDRLCKENLDAGFYAKARGSTMQQLACGSGYFGDFDCGGGFGKDPFTEIQVSGTPQEECYTYTPVDQNCPASCENTYTNGASMSWTAGRYKCDSSTVYNTNNFQIAAMQQEIYDNGPMNTCLDVYQDFNSYSSGIYEHVSGSLLGGHAVEILGWGDDGGTPIWYVKNSWGTGWGESGYFKVARNAQYAGCKFAEWAWSCKAQPCTHACGEICSSQSYVCTGHGTCASQDVCNCDAGWTGSDCENVDNCSPSCSIHGNCVSSACVCENGWSGTTCSVQDCDPICVNGVCSGGSCSCTSGWNGAACDSAICSPVCSSHGSCTSPNSCTCQPTYTGSTCSDPLCSPVCTSHGTCTTGSPNTCSCESGWSGSDCSQPSCSPDCGTHGSCTAPNSCSCDPGWTGSACSDAICSPECVNGDCTGPNVCTCDAGWSGSKCDIASCDNPCQHGNCTSPNTCTCDPGWGGAVCNTMECFGYTPENAGVCSGHGTCTGPNTCVCDANWHGEMCNHNVVPGAVCYGIPSENPATCCGHGSCIALDTCTCDINWELEPTCCEPYICYDIQFDNPGVCSGNGECKCDVRDRRQTYDELYNCRCKCEKDWKGDECEEEKPNSNIVGTVLGVVGGIGGGMVGMICLLGIIIVIVVLVVLVVRRGGFSKTTYTHYSDESEDSSEAVSDEEQSYQSSAASSGYSKPKSFPKMPQPQQSYGKPKQYGSRPPPQPISRAGFNKPGSFVGKLPKKPGGFNRPMPKKPAGNFGRRPGGFNRPPPMPKKPGGNFGRPGGFNKFGGKPAPRPGVKKFGGKPAPRPGFNKTAGRFNKQPPKPAGFNRFGTGNNRRGPPVKKRPPPKARQRGPPPGCVKIVQAYQATKGDELTIKVGDFVKVLERCNDGWIYGQFRGKKGYFPGNFSE